MSGFISYPYFTPPPPVAVGFVGAVWQQRPATIFARAYLLGQVAWGVLSTFLVGGDALTAGETDALGIDFTYHADRTKQMSVNDTGTPANAGDFDPYTKLTYTSPSIKLCRQSDGVWRYGSHNLYLNSASPATQSVTVVNGGTYNVDITGSVNITLSNAATGTITAGSNAITAASTTLTLTLNSGTGTVAVYRTPCVGTYLATTSAAVYDLPYEWDAAGVAQGIRIEEQRTNLCLRSDDFTNASWTKSNMTTAYTSTGPDGVANSASRLTATAGNATALQAITSASAARISSVFVKRITGSGNIDVTQDNGTTWTTVTVTSAWTRVSIAAQTLTNPTVGIRIVTSGDAIDVFRFQHELGSFITSPIHTIGATVTRAADDLTLANTLYPESDSAGTMVVAAMIPFTPSLGIWKYLLSIDNGSAEKFTLFNDSGSTNVLAVVTDGGVDQATLTMSSISANTTFKAAMAYALNDIASVLNGGTVQTDATATMPTTTNMRFGEHMTAVQQLNGYLRQVTYLKRRATNTELQTRTT